MKRKIIIGNWKMNPTSLLEAQSIFKKIKVATGRLSSTHVVMCPPSIYISKFSNRTASSTPSLVGLGAQNVYFENQGAFTGEISPLMLKDLGVSHIIVGHSERRAMGETDEMVAKKVLAVLEAGIHPVLCVGESERDQHALYLDILRDQIKNSLAKTPKRLINQIIIAYEPLWEIGVKEAMDPAIVQEMAIFIKKIISDMFGHDEALKTPVLYGGSTNFRSAPDIVTRGKVDGLLVGRESVNVPGFIELLKAVDGL